MSDNAGSWANLQFIGAAKEVTGSSYLVTFAAEHNAKGVMVDHGMFQGPGTEDLNMAEYLFSPSEVGWLFLTHAHVDHCGRLPMLVKRGFKGVIYTTSETFQLVEQILFDSARVQEMNHNEYGSAVMYDQTDVIETLALFSFISLNETYDITLSEHLSANVEFLRAGHILGAASIYLKFKSDIYLDSEIKMLFSGDIGRTDAELIKTFREEKREVDYVLMESLYGGKVHPAKDLMRNELARVVTETHARKGVVIIPAFAVQRTQEILYSLNKLILEGKISSRVNIFVDGRMGTNVTRLYLQHKDSLEPRAFKGFENIDSAVISKNVQFIRGKQEMRKVVQQEQAIIIAGSGMCTGGKVVSYLKRTISGERNTVCIVGFQAEETLGRELISGKKEVVIDGAEFEVKALIENLSGFSAHGDQIDLDNWFKGHVESTPKKVFLIHAEIEQSTAFKNHLIKSGLVEEQKIDIPSLFATYKL